MNNIYVENGYAVCKIIANSINSKENNYISCNSKEDFFARTDFIKEHNLASIWSSVTSQNNSDAHKDYEKYGVKMYDSSHHIFRQMKFDAMREKVSKHFSHYGIRHIVLKGCSTEKFYPKNVIRTSADIDIFVDKTDYARVKTALEELGFYFEKTYDEKTFHFKKEPRYYIEIHTWMEGFSNKQQELLLSLCDNAVKIDGERYELTDSDAYVYSMFHLYKHFVYSGVGVRMFLDNYLIERNGNIDFSYAEKILEELEAGGFVNTVRKINRVLFEDDVADDELQEVISFVFDSGVFGKHSTLLHLNEITSVTKHRKGFKGFSMKYGLSYSSMCKRYPILKKHPLLYPFSFIHRFFNGIIHKRDVLKSEKELKDSLSKERINECKRIFNIANIRI